jgi:hypothetical protein
MTRCHFRAQKSLDFLAHPFQCPYNVFTHIKIITSRTMNNRYINSYQKRRDNRGRGMLIFKFSPKEEKILE